MHADENSWFVVRPTDAKTRSVVDMPTAIFTFVRFIPGGAATGVGDGVGKFLQMAESTGYEGRSEVIRMMESLILDDSRSTQL